jgi:hypothetical protein
MFIDYKRIIKIIGSCENFLQLMSADNCCNLFRNKWGDGSYPFYLELQKKYDAKLAEIEGW